MSQKIAQNKNSNTNQSFSRNQATLEARYAVMNVPEFSGKDTRKVFEFVEKVDNVYKIVDINQMNLLNVLILNKLTDDAEQLVRDHKPDNWQESRRILNAAASSSCGCSTGGNTGGNTGCCSTDIVFNNNKKILEKIYSFIVVGSNV